MKDTKERHCVDSNKVSVLSVDSEEGKTFVQLSCGLPASAESGFATIKNRDLELQLATGGVSGNINIPDDVDKAVLLVHHMDLLSVQQLRSMYHAVEKNPEMRTLIALYKKSDEHEFKISCIECGQKMWIPEGREGSKAKCPKCRKHFEIRTRENHMRMVLGVLEGVPAEVVEANDPQTFKMALAKLLGVKPSRSSSAVSA